MGVCPKIESHISRPWKNLNFIFVTIPVKAWRVPLEKRQVVMAPELLDEDSLTLLQKIPGKIVKFPKNHTITFCRNSSTREMQA